jgi:hypothetical protein
MGFGRSSSRQISQYVARYPTNHRDSCVRAKRVHDAKRQNRHYDYLDGEKLKQTCLLDHQAQRAGRVLFRPKGDACNNSGADSEATRLTAIMTFRYRANVILSLVMAPDRSPIAATEARPT